MSVFFLRIWKLFFTVCIGTSRGTYIFNRRLVPKYFKDIGSRTSWFNQILKRHLDIVSVYSKPMSNQIICSEKCAVHCRVYTYFKRHIAIKSYKQWGICECFCLVDVGLTCHSRDRPYFNIKVQVYRLASTTSPMVVCNQYGLKWSNATYWGQRSYRLAKCLPPLDKKPNQFTVKSSEIWPSKWPNIFLRGKLGSFQKCLVSWRVIGRHLDWARISARSWNKWSNHSSDDIHIYIFIFLTDTNT